MKINIHEMFKVFEKADVLVNFGSIRDDRG